MEEYIRTIYDDLPDIHSWSRFSPNEAQYMRYDTNILMTAIKVVDTYTALCIARANLHFLDNQEFGDYARDVTSINFVKSLHIQNALIYYNIAVDYSWQVLWLYYNDWIAQELPTSELYKDSIKDCNYDELLLGLTLKRDFKMRDNIVKPFFSKNPYYQQIRPKYNYLKHRGTYHFEGLGLNDTNMMFSVNISGKEVQPPLIARERLDIASMKDLLVKFDDDFVEYMEYLIKLLLPADFSDGTMSFEGMLNYSLRYFRD
ncbi:hypothetical protein LJC34_03990 [Oscillospiraceae bacterium OttesenSCG-928-G22]|nr:hypothetical protein [Eubacteriales bacterium OttesenSCG-928-K08]MDL2273688.1 hypothetical protein [Oscillospiraceae bacterium OttesenSCG-928-G22]MDL2288035.1 hypothetical protein [Oscillospiraceae bacterium OttesenSCG-928-F05]MDL2300066.1 hypothetical protein [Clostridiaceae bacterium OttesenSCG-928-D20]